MPLTTTLRAGTLGYTNVIATDDSGSTTDVLGPITIQQIYNNGTAANQADKAFREKRTLTGAAQTYLLSALAGSQGFLKAKLMFVQVDPTSTGSLAIAPGVSNGWPGLTLGRPLVAGSNLLITWPTIGGAAVAAAATEQVTFTATGAVTYIVTFIGAST